MPENFDGEWEIRLYYTVTISSVVLEHRHTFDFMPDGDIFPGSDLNAVDVILKSGATQNIVDAIGAVYLPLVQEFYPTTTDFGRVEIWQYPVAGQNAVFINQFDANLSGTSGSAAVRGHQSTFTYRSINGGVGRMQFMEDVFTGLLIQNYPVATSAVQDYADYLVGGTSMIRARDNGVPIGNIHYCGTQNEKIDEKRIRG